MYPNTHDVVPLPSRPSLEQYRKYAKELAAACKSGVPDAIGAWSARWPAQTQQIEPFARTTLTSRDCALTAAQFVVARIHGFASWPVFAAHLEGLAVETSPASAFEAAAEAVITGDAATLQRLLREHPELIRARSAREHRAMLLHYAAANGVENSRQTTPPNAVAIARMLLEAGADVDAEAEIYGGGCTTLGLVATSIHPERAGVQNALMQLLIDHGAVIDHQGGVGNNHSFVVGCLANGRPAAAAFLASRGAHLDLEGAAGVGRVDLVTRYVNADGTLSPDATVAQMRAGFGWACEYGHTPVVELLLDRGLRADTELRSGETGLHWAALGGHGAVVSLLLARHAPVNIVDGTHSGTPLAWARFGQRNAGEAARDRYDEVMALLIGAGGN